MIWLAPAIFMLTACGENEDDLWSGGSGWMIGLLVGLLLLVLIVGAMRRNKRR